MAQTGIMWDGEKKLYFLTTHEPRDNDRSVLDSSGIEDRKKVNRAQKNSLKTLFSMCLAKTMGGTGREEEGGIGREELQV